MRQFTENVALAEMFERNVFCMLGLPFDAVDLAGTVGRVRDAAARRQPLFLSTPTLNFLVACLNDRTFRNSVVRSDLSVADGMPIVWASRWRERPRENQRSIKPTRINSPAILAGRRYSHNSAQLAFSPFRPNVGRLYSQFPLGVCHSGWTALRALRIWRGHHMG